MKQTLGMQYVYHFFQIDANFELTRAEDVP